MLCLGKRRKCCGLEAGKVSSLLQALLSWETGELQLFVEKGKGAIKKESARKSKWPEKVLDDFIDIVVSSNSYKRKLIFTHCKSQKNGPIYEKILEELNVRAFSRGEVITSTVPQLRCKFKKCVSVYKQAVLTQKSCHQNQEVSRVPWFWEVVSCSPWSCQDKGLLPARMGTRAILIKLRRTRAIVCKEKANNERESGCHYSWSHEPC